MPGQTRFALELEEALEKGESVLLRLPLYAPPTLVSEVKGRMTTKVWHALRPKEALPLHFLYDHYVLDHSPGQLRNIQAIYEQDTFRGKIIEISVDHEKQLNCWLEFVKEFAEFTRTTVELLDRASILLICRGPLSISPGNGTNEVNFTEKRWDGYAGRLDCRLAASYSLGTFRHSVRNSLKLNLTESISCELALWDIDLAERLAEENIETLFSPLEFLKERANSLGMEGHHPTSRDIAWADGWLQEVDGRDEWHSCRLAAETKTHQDLMRRVWKGQLAVLLPYLEIERHKLIIQNKHALHIPYSDQNERDIPRDYSDLEWGHLKQQLCRQHNISREIKHAVRMYTKARNDMAHFRPLKPEFISDGILHSPPWEVAPENW